MTDSQQRVDDFCVALKIDKDHDVFIFDPYMINMKDLQAVGIKNLVRINKPAWGKGNISEFVTKIGYEEFKDTLVKSEEVEDGS